MGSRIYLPTKESDWVLAITIAILLIILSWIANYIEPYIAKYIPHSSNSIIAGIIVGIVAGIILSVIGFRKWAAIAFALAVGNGIANYVDNHLKV